MIRRQMEQIPNPAIRNVHWKTWNVLSGEEEISVFNHSSAAI